MNKFYTTTILLFAIICVSYAQNDTLILNNGDVIVGDLKSMDRGVLTIEPPYSDSDFKIEWEKIKVMKATKRYLITLSHGQRINGTFRSSSDGKIFIDNEKGEDRTVDPSEIVYINEVDDSFLSRLSANIDFGFTLTKTNNQRQLNGNLRMGYLADRWSTDLYFNSLITTQNDVAKIERNDAGLGSRYFLPADWFILADLSLLSNTEQSLDLRTTGMIGIGNYVVHTNTAYWANSVGGAYNHEIFSPVFNPDDGTTSTTPGRNSFEGFVGTELDLYDIGDLNLFTNLIVYPTIVRDEATEPGRIRTDFRLEVEYDDIFIKDFYIRLGFILNYDNRPVEAGKEVDYIFTTGFGWEW
jgi:hypothetical protein